MEARGAKGVTGGGETEPTARGGVRRARRKPKQHVWSRVRGRRTAKRRTRGPGEEQVWKDEKGKAAGSEP